MNVVHIIRDLDARSGGPSRSVPALAAAQSNLPGLEVNIFFRDRGNQLAPLVDGVVRHLPVTGSIVPSLMALQNSTEKPVIHLHGLWDPALHHAARHAKKFGWPYVVSTRGMLAGWALRHKALKKRVAWTLYQENDLRNAACLVASSEFERQCIDDMLPGQRIEVIPNGCDDRSDFNGAEFHLPGDQCDRWALTMGRLHPIKGYAELIDAWAKVRPAGWKLAIAGPDEDGYRVDLEKRIRQHGLENQAVLLGEVDDSAKWSLLDRCELFLAPSHTENFGMAIAEALLSGKPVLTTTGTPWQELLQHECGWWVAPETGAIAGALRVAVETPPSVLGEMGQRGRRLIRENYSWDSVAARSVELYRSLIAS